VKAIGAWIRGRLAGRADTEHEQALVRIGMYVVLLSYMLPALTDRIAAGNAGPHIAMGIGYCVASVVLFAAILVAPAPSPIRRFIGMLLDISCVTWCMAFYDDYSIPFFLVYVWVTLANGFRFGPKALMMSLGLSIVGFSSVLLLSNFWRTHLGAGIGMLVCFTMLSLYIRKLVTQLFDAVARAEAANLAKRRFISVVSHEMRTPLNAIIGMADLMRDTSLNREQADMLQTLRSSSRMMLGLVEDVLDFSKIEAGKLVLEAADFDLHALVNSTSRMLAAQASAKGVDCVVSIMPEVPPALRGDPHYLRQVLVNLIGNAIKFTERGSVTVHISAQSETDAAVQLKFSIRDTGIGMTPEAQQRIFDSFTQADQSTTRRFGGTGLGTTIAKQLVELMGGRIGVESAVGLGSTFWFELSLRKQPGRAEAGSGELAGARVLLVGFPEALREPIEHALAGWGAQSVAAAGLHDAVAKIVAEISLAKPYHSALLYGATGNLALAQQFRKAAPDPAPPAVLAAPREAGVQRFEALSAGFTSVLELPFDKRQLFNVLHSVSAGTDVGHGVVRLQDYAHRAADSRKLNVLVADDNPTNRQVIGKILERGGHAVTLVYDGDQALDAVENGRYDIVILDRNMPNTGGIEALQAMRLMTRGRERLPVILLSADATPEARQEALEAGADAFLSKPVEAVRLLEEIVALASASGEAKGGGAAVTPHPAAAGRAAPAPAPSAVINMETLGHLEELGSSPGFVEKLVGVFVADNSGLLARIEGAMAGRSYQEVRTHLHALKGSSASMGAERLTRLCSSLNAMSDAEMRLQGPGLLRSLAEELASARRELERYVSERRSTSAG
jgi:two-component system sensor histidine kinase RpfC